MATIGERLIALKERSGLSLAAIAERAGYRSASSIQKLFNAGYDPGKLSQKVAAKLAEAFAGVGEPEIERYELISLSGDVDRLRRHQSIIQYQLHTLNNEIFLSASVALDDLFWDDSNNGLSAFMIVSGPEMGYFKKPEHLRDRKLRGVIVSTANMSPRIRVGDTIIIDEAGSANVGQDAIFEVAFSDNVSSFMTLGILASINDDYVEFDQLQPPMRLRLRRGFVSDMHPVLMAVDLLGKAKGVQWGID